MKAKEIIGLYLFLLCTSAFGQNTDLEQFERFFTWDPDSTAIYVTPDLESQELIKLPYGIEIERLAEVHEPKVNVLIGELDGTPNRPERLGSYTLPTFWVKVRYENSIGYALNAEVINFPPMKYEHDSYDIQIEDFQAAYKGEIKDTIYDKQWMDTKYKSEINDIIFPDGNVLKFSSLDGCVKRSIASPKFTMAQAYFLLKTWHFVPTNEYMTKNAQKMSLQDAKNSLIRFISPVLSDYQTPYLEILSNGYIEIGSSFCD